jgi:shikimate dehydrogenase
MHMAAYEVLGLPYRYVAVRVAAGEVGAALDHLKGLGYRGVNVTVPHKEEAFGWAASSDAFARRVGAANTFDLLSGACVNTDGPGFMDTTSSLVVGKALVLGAGGSARAIVAALVEAGWPVSIHNRTAAKAEALALEFGAEALSEPILDGADLVVNTTSASLQGETLACGWSSVSPDALAYDLMYGKPSPFLAEAAGFGLKTQDGLELLVAQGARSLEYWLGVEAPRDAMRKALCP